MSRFKFVISALLVIFVLVSFAGCANYGPTTTAVNYEPSLTTSDSIPEFSVIVLPDTQYYSQSYPHIFKAQTQWIADNKERLNVIFVTHSGDIVNDAGDYDQWYFADMAMDLLDGKVPYGVLPGNHDFPTDLYNQYFGATRFMNYEWYGGHYGDNNDNSYQLISTNGIDLIFIELQFDPTPEIVTWADSILKQYQDRLAILNTHSALETDGTFTSEGEGLMPLLEDNNNLLIVLCGHVHGEAEKTLSFPSHKTDILLADYQKLEKGGSGYLRILTFAPDKSKISVQTYSPFLDTYITDENSLFELNFPVPITH